MRTRNRDGITAAVALGCCVILFFGLNTISRRTLAGARLDLTSQHLYTLSPGTSAILAGLEEPITIRLYYSNRLGENVPAYGAYARAVREMLDEYAARANGKLRLQIIDPRPYSPDEDRAAAFGLQAVPVNASGEQVYFGIAATNSTDDQQVIAFLHADRERFLEYDLTKLVHALAVARRTHLGILSALPLDGDMMAAAMQGQPARPFALMDQLRQLYDVRMLGGDLDRIPADIDVLMLVHPAGLSERAEYAIDQFVLGGGKALVFLDPLSEYQEHDPSPLNAPGTPHASSLERLMKAWGVRMDPGTVIADRLAARRVNAGGAARIRAVDHLGWLALRESNFNHDEPITADLRLVNVATAGAIEPINGARTTFEPLISTSLASMRIATAQFRGTPDLLGLLSRFRPEGRSYVLAARVTGPATTAFPDGPPAAPATKDAAAPRRDATPPPRLAASTQPIDVVVVGDTDLLSDRFWTRASDFFGRRVVASAANNADFVANAIDVLAGGPQLTGLRSRGTASRPFDVVLKLQQAADDRYSAEEHDLQEKLRDTRARLRDLQAGAPPGKEQAGPPVLTAEQSRTIDTFRAELLRTQQELRSVQTALRRDIEALKTTLEIINIALVPILVVIAAIVIAVLRRRRLRRGTAMAIAARPREA